MLHVLKAEKLLNFQCSTDFKLFISFTDFGHRFGSSIDFENYGLPHIIENYRIQNSLLRTQAKYKLCRQHLFDCLFFLLLFPFSLTFLLTNGSANEPLVWWHLVAIIAYQILSTFPLLSLLYKRLIKLQISFEMVKNEDDMACSELSHGLSLMPV